MRIREYVEHADKDGWRLCLVELQDFERRIDARLPRGEDIAEDYLSQLLQRCKQCDGKVLVAEIDAEIAGYVAVLTKVQSDEIGDGDTEFGLVADLVVLEQFRQQGVGKKLLEAAEKFARECDAKWLRIGVIAGNQAADDLYSSMGYDLLYVEREKDLTRRK